ncbi:MAG: cupredoxin domain-containing protein [Thiomonas sp.]
MLGEERIGGRIRVIEVCVRCRGFYERKMSLRRTIMRLHTRLAILPLLALPVLALGATVQVRIQGMNFHPSAVTVAPGTTVTWTNDDNFAHTTTSDTKRWDSGLLPPGQSYSHTFDKAGSYPYHCAVHTFMTGTVTVK